MIIRVLALVVVVAGCTDARPSLVVSGQVALGQIGYAGPVLDQARQDFIGSGGGFPGLGDVPVPYGDAAAAAVVIAAQRSVSVAPGLTVQSRAYADLGATTARLPQGLGVFTDPARVAMMAAGLGAEIALQRAYVTPGGQRVIYGVGTGLTRTLAYVDIQSALIDRQSSVWLTQGYATLHSRYQIRSGVELAADLRLFTAASEVRLGVARTW